MAQLTDDLTVHHRIVWLIRTLDEARQAWNSNAGDGGVLLMPSDYHEGSYRELEDWLVLMRRSHPSAVWHLLERYRRGQHQTLELQLRSRAKKAGLVGPWDARLGHDLYVLPPHTEVEAGQAVSGKRTARVRVYRWDARVDMGKVRAGVEFLARSMHGGRRSRIVLPDALYRRLVGMPPREGRRDRSVPTIGVAA